MQLLNSLLFVPASRPERIAKAMGVGADAVIVDLEDAIAPCDKDGARAALSAILDTARPIMLRINGAHSPWFRADLDLLRQPGISAVILPKAEHIDDVEAVKCAAGGISVLPMIESALGFQRRLKIAQAKGVNRLIFGHIDFQSDMGMHATEDELLPFRLGLVLASRLSDIGAPIDGVTTAIDDLNQLRADAIRARRLGFSGKLCIHPHQVSVVNECFSPSVVELVWARRVIEAHDAAGGSAIAFEGKMVDLPVVLRARSILSSSATRTR